MKIFTVLLLAVFCFAPQDTSAQTKKKFNWNKVVGVSVSDRLCPGETIPVEEYTITKPAEIRTIIAAFHTKPDRIHYLHLPIYNIFLKDDQDVVLQGWGGLFGISLSVSPNETYWFTEEALVLIKSRAQGCRVPKQ